MQSKIRYTTYRNQQTPYFWTLLDAMEYCKEIDIQDKFIIVRSSHGIEWYVLRARENKEKIILIYTHNKMQQYYPHITKKALTTPVK